MYNDYFGLREAPFSIAPNPQYLFMSPRHREALAHLLYGIQSDGGFILLTGEVGTGKTTVCRCLLEQIPEDVDTAYILNPKQTAEELLATACDELHVDYPDNASIKVLVDCLNDFLLTSHQQGRRTVLIIDEAQNLSVDVLEQLRLLTNLETNQRKLLQVILLGQPELLILLARQELRQLSQRVTARFHMDALEPDEVADYVQHRLDIAGAKGTLFPAATIRRIYKISRGIPRLINLICDRALLGTYVQNRLQVDVETVNHAAKEILGEQKNTQHMGRYLLAGMAVLLLIATGVAYFTSTSTLSPTAVADTTTGGAIMDTPGPAISNQSQSSVPAIQQVQPAQVEAEPVITPAIPANSLAVVMPQQIQNDAAAAVSEMPQRVITSVTQAPGYAEQTQAFKALMRLWGSDVVLAEDSDPCQVAEVSGLRCLSKLGSLRDIAHLNRPVLINLTTEVSSQWYILTQLDEDAITVTTEDDAYHLSRDEVLSLWSGFYTLLWKTPPAYQQPIKRGDRGPTVDHLMTLLANAEGLPAPAINGNRLFDADLERRVKRFQISVGLVPDGIVGAQTWIHLNRADDNTIPTLMPTRGAG